jgi:hypothetical protein
MLKQLQESTSKEERGEFPGGDGYGTGCLVYDRIDEIGEMFAMLDPGGGVDEEEEREGERERDDHRK